MSLSKINFQKIDSHEAVTSLVKAIADVIKNPPDMKEAVAESHRLIQQARSEQAKVDADRLHLQAETTALNDQHKARKREMDKQAEDVAHAAKDLDRRIAKHESDKIDIDGLKNQIAAQEKDVKARDSASQAREKQALEQEAKLKTFEATLQGRERLIEEKERNISERESKLRQILS